MGGEVTNVISFHTFDSVMTISCVFEPVGNCEEDPARFHVIEMGVEPVAMQLRLTFSNS